MARGCRGGPGGGGGGWRRGVVLLAVSAVPLRADRCGEIGVALPVGAFRLRQQHRERRLQAVREVAGFGLRALHHFVALGKQDVEVVHQRLHL